MDPTIFDKAVHRLAIFWFEHTADRLPGPVNGCLELLDRHSVPWREQRSAHPGERIDEDDVQVVLGPQPATPG